MPKAEKLRRLKAGMKVRPPKKWWNKMYKKVSRQKKYSRFGRKRKSKITAGIWHKHKKATKIRIVRKYG